ncbi:hypothetical protein C2I36_11715 [Rhodobacteraceae bacterium WD3A24]|nr:hypothetical protein C2I36_11715 [Rhodobacteraceae bacterium WD3A24]
MGLLRGLPKQWIVRPATGESRQAAGSGGVEPRRFQDREILTAPGVPVHRLTRPDGGDFGRVIGWVISAGRLHHRDDVIELEPDDLAQWFRDLGGSFVMLWRDAKGVHLREDASGGLPCVFHPDYRIAASTTSALARAVEERLEPDEEANAVFAFPKRIGFLPFGLTSCRDVRRLQPNHVLDLDTFAATRVWPDAGFRPAGRMSAGECRAAVAEACDIVRRNLRAVLEAGSAVLYLSGGHDSRMVLAAGQGLAGTLNCETYAASETLDSHIAARVAAAAGRRHRRVPILPASHEDIDAWVARTGHSIYDNVTHLCPTAEANADHDFTLAGTIGELARASNWMPGDAHRENLDMDTLLQRLRLPGMPVIRRAGEIWRSELPDADAARMLDIAKIEVIQGCWAGASAYGHALSLPTLHVFSGQRLNEIALSLDKDYRDSAGFYRDFMQMAAPALLEIRVNRAAGLDRLRFAREELRELTPTRIKRLVKPLR